MKITNIDLKNQQDFYDAEITDLDLNNETLENKAFANCKFIKSNFSNAKLLDCAFTDCEFISCNLSSADLKNSSFNEVIFDECKIIGINWTRVKWPYIKLTSPIKFYKSNISHSSFFELELREIVIQERCLSSKLSHKKFYATTCLTNTVLFFWFIRTSSHHSWHFRQ